MLNQEIYWEIPDSVDLEGFLKKYPPNFDFKYKIDHFYSIIDYICKGMEREDLDDNKGFVNLNAQKLQQSNKKYKTYLEHLLNHGFLRTDMKYIVGSKSTGYMINKYSNHKASPKQIPIVDFVTKKNKAKEAKETINELKQEAKEHFYLAKWFDEKLQIDAPRAKQKVEELFPEQTGGIKGTKKGKASRWTKRYKAIQSIQKFERQDFYYGVDKNVGRFHSNLTNIKLELRHYITYDGQKLVNVDIKNAQPLFSTLLLNESFWDQSELPSIYQFTTNNTSQSNQPLLTSLSITIIMLVKVLQKLDNQEFDKYKSMVYSGKFYEEISNLFYSKAVFNKQKIKEMIYTVFFSNNRYMGQIGAKPKRDFKAHFPEVYEIFRLIKKGNHSLLSHILQRIESTIMIQYVARRIAEEKPDLPIFTIHDSIATTLGNEDYVTSVIQEEAFKLTGLKVQLGKEYWD